MGEASPGVGNLLVFERVRKLFRNLRQHRLAAVLTLATIVGILGAGGYLAACHFEAKRRFRIAQEALEQRDWPRARSNLALCLEVWPGSTEVHCLAARAARRDGDYEDAARHLGDCRRLPGGAEAAELEDALLHAQQGDLAAVDGYLRERLKQDDDNTPLILEALTQGYANSYRVPQALNCATRWVSLQPENPQALYWRGLMWDRLFSPPDALTDYRRAVELDPEFDEARGQLAGHLLETGRSQEALEHFQRLTRAHPGDIEAALGLARCWDKLGQFARARNLLDRLLTVDPGHVRTLVERGRVALHMNTPAEAARWLRKAVAASPHEREANYLLFQCLQQEGKGEEAKIYLQKVQQFDADFHRLEEVREKLLVKPWDLALRLEAARIMLRNGQAKEGLNWLDGILRDAPGHRPTHQALADYYAQTGDVARAAHHRLLAREGNDSSPSR
ncbi:MAG TPA: tetratricopeptide repeat protein [Gemmataceae bacterium]|nr:tetratricopeptide repeat protein [Gemmataceae bacterium]